MNKLFQKLPIIFLILAVVFFIWSQAFGGDEGYPIFILSLYVLILAGILAIIVLISNLVKRKK